MKKLLFINFLLVFLLTGCFNSRDYVLDYDYSYNGKFKRYKTFDFIDTSGSTIGSKFEANDELIQKIIGTKLKTQGYTHTEKKPSFFIYYTLFDKNFEFASVNQPDINYWARYTKKDNKANEEEEEQDEITEKEEAISKDQQYFFSDKELNDGTLMIMFWDRRRNKQIWRGYISGVFKQDKRDLNEIYLKSAVNRVLNQYKFFAKGYIN